jgi:hypothetical protein
MKTFLTHFAIITIAMYLIVVFISMTPNVMVWEVGGRAAFLFFAFIFSVVSSAVAETTTQNK